MTVPIARVVATRYAQRGAAAALLLLRARLPRRAPAARAAARVPPGGDRAGGRAGARGDRRGPDRAVRGAGRRGAARLSRGAGRRVAVPGAAGLLRRAAEARGRRCCTSWSPATSSALERELARAGLTTTPRGALRVPQVRGGADVLETPPGRWRTRRGCARARRCCRRRSARAGDLRPRAVARPRLLHRRGLRGLRPRAGPPLGGGGRYDDLLGRFGRALPAAGFALGVERLHLALTGEERWAR